MDYQEVSDQIKLLDGSKIIGYVSSSSEQFPLYQIKRGRGKKTLLSGVIHGDEPAGVYAILSFFENHIHEYENDFEFTVFPCVNPWGFQNFTRGNKDNLNLNREFKKDTNAKEIQFILPLLERYIFAMDLHETWTNATRIGDNEPQGKDPNEFFLWETCEDISARVGDRIVKNIERAGLSICKWPRIYGDKNNGGVIWYPEDCGTECYTLGTSFDSFIKNNHTDQSFTIETPRSWTLERRMLAHIISLRTVLDVKKQN